MSTGKNERDLWSMSGMTIAATSAAVASFSGLRGLAAAAGWPEHLSWLLPVTVDAYAMTSTRLWLAGRKRDRRARRFAAANALGAIASSVAGNAIYHALSTGLLTVTWPIVVSVGAVPAAVLGLIAHLHALHSGTESVPEDDPATSDEAEQDLEPNEPAWSGAEDGRSPISQVLHRPRQRTEAELLDAARAADQRHRQRYGRPITRDALRAALKISGSRATELRRRLATDSPAVLVPDAKEVATRP